MVVENKKLQALKENGRSFSDTVWSLGWNFNNGNLAYDRAGKKYIIKMLLSENVYFFKPNHFTGKVSIL